MTLNLSRTDRRTRFALAAILGLVAVFATSGTPQLVLAAIVLVATASVGTCPATLAVGASTLD